ncbi:hypothetical protein L208DRAFT_1305862 [Tricholoma matsutake]|nr:hypothetical protein L208DRAFT_1305862 [Tricholoma matsutake 945]
MTNPEVSPISQLLHTLGITREDLEKRSDQMRQFLTAQNLDFDPLRITKPETSIDSSFGAETRLTSMASTSTASSSRSMSRANSYSLRDTTPITPVKSEIIECSVPLRHFDSMEMVIERQRRQNRRERKERRGRERESAARTSVPQPPSPSPSNPLQTGPILPSHMESRDERHVLPSDAQDTVEGTTAQQSPAAFTPQRSKYYREHTELSTSARLQPRRDDSFIVKAEQATPTRPRTSTLPQSHSSELQYYSYPQYLAYAQLLPPLVYGHPQSGSSALPVTPQPQRTNTMPSRRARSPLPPSSPPPASSPISTPNRPIVNLVSSPGPLGPLPDEEEYDTLPFTLPPGPYPPNKPDASYAALVGQAILSSPEHRLTLQEIYDYITIVYPFFKRDEQTWMNSIRHVLSTTVCFRKVPRERSVGRTLWAIWDEDLECFKGGGFRKQLCKDIVGRTGVRDTSRTKSKGRKRTDSITDGRKAKRSKKDHSVPTSPSLPAPFSYQIFPATRPTPHHQPYYESCLPQQQPLPGDIIFPPLPSGVAYTRIGSTANVQSSSVAGPQGGQIGADREDTPSSIQSHTRVPSPPPSSASSVSVPELTPNRSSSSPPPATSELDGNNSAVIDNKAHKTSFAEFNLSVDLDDMDEALDVSADGEEDPDNDLLLGPVRFWRGSPKTACNTLQPGIKLAFDSALEEEDELLTSRSKTAKKPDKGKRKKRISFPPVPTSPTLNRKATSKVPKSSQVNKADIGHSTSPPPSTPPRGVRELPISSVRTPLSKKDAVALGNKGDVEMEEVDTNRTPQKRPLDYGPAPVTPRKLAFPPNQNESPYRTPGGVFGLSPFRTPSSRAVFDPHDPGALLDEELSRMGVAGHGDSPGGLFGKARGSLLYDSPGLSSPDQWQRWW